MNDDYLWDKSGEPDPEVEHLEKLLGRFRHSRPAFEFPAAGQPWRRVLPLIPPSFNLRALAAAAVVLLLLAGGWFAWRWTRPSWEVESMAGAPRVGFSRIGQTGRLAVGQALETDQVSRARINVGDIGEVEVEPNSRVRLMRARSTEHRLALDRGTLHARIWAPPRLFYVNTPSAVAVDLGCRYTLQVDAQGASHLHVTMGWVAFEQTGRESFVPAGAMCVMRPGLEAGTPYYEDASDSFRAALAQFDSRGAEAPAELRTAALKTVLVEARKRDALTLWHLLSRTTDAERAAVYDRLAQFVPPPSGVTREGILAGAPEVQRQMRDLWWDALGLGDTSWWRKWKGPVPSR